MRITKWLPLLAMLLTAGATAWAAPALINYQGRLTDAAGQPISAPVSITFTFWDSETTGTQLGSGYSDTQNITPDPSGIYATLVGNSPNNPLPVSIFESDSVWLNVQINGEDLAPRKRIVSAGYSLSAETIKGMEMGRQTFVAAEPLKAGDLVAVNSNGRLQRADNAGWNRKTIFSRQTVDYIGGALIGPNKILIVYRVTQGGFISSGVGAAVVASIDANRNVTYGTSVTLSNAMSSSPRVARLAPDKALVVFNEGVFPSTGTAVVVSASGLTPTRGTPVPFAPSAVGDCGVAALDANKALIAYTSGFGADPVAVAATASGSTLTLGTPAAYNTGSATLSSMVTLNTNKAMLVFQKDGVSDQATLRAVTASGTTLSFGSAATYNAAGLASIYTAPLTTDKAIVASNGDQSVASIVTASGSTLTIGASLTLPNFNAGPMAQMGDE